MFHSLSISFSSSSFFLFFTFFHIQELGQKLLRALGGGDSVTVDPLNKNHLLAILLDQF